jgi:hypothetical protein
MWFNEKFLQSYSNISSVFINNLKGFVLPHASLFYTYNIMLHTFRFRPSTILFNKVIIFYYPSSKSEDVETKDNKYYHEYYTVWKSCEYLIKILLKILKIHSLLFQATFLIFYLLKKL